MKKLLLIFLYSCFAGMLCEVNAQHMVFYTNQEDGYSMKIPEDWRRTDTFSTKLSLVALAPEETEAEDGVRESMNVVIYQLNGKTKEEFYTQYKASHEKEHMSWKVSSEGEVKARGTVATYFVSQYSGGDSGRTNVESVYVFSKDEKTFVLTCSTSYDELGQYKETFEKIGQSFSFSLQPEE